MSDLTTLFTNIANSIRTKTGSSAQIQASTFPTKVSSILSLDCNMYNKAVLIDRQMLLDKMDEVVPSDGVFVTSTNTKPGESGMLREASIVLARGKRTRSGELYDGNDCALCLETDGHSNGTSFIYLALWDTTSGTRLVREIIYACNSQGGGGSSSSSSSSSSGSGGGFVFIDPITPQKLKDFLDIISNAIMLVKWRTDDHTIMPFVSNPAYSCVLTDFTLQFNMQSGVIEATAKPGTLVLCKSIREYSQQN